MKRTDENEVWMMEEEDELEKEEEGEKHQPLVSQLRAKCLTVRRCGSTESMSRVFWKQPIRKQLSSWPRHI